MNHQTPLEMFLQTSNLGLEASDGISKAMADSAEEIVQIQVKLSRIPRGPFALSMAQPIIRQTTQSFQLCAERLDAEATKLKRICSGWEQGSASMPEAIEAEPELSKDEKSTLISQFARSAKSAREAGDALDSYRDQVSGFRDILPAFKQPAQNLVDAVSRVIEACQQTATYFDGQR